MGCTQILSSSLFCSISVVSNDAHTYCCRGALFASYAHNLVPITASSALRPRAISRPLARRTFSPEEKEAHARAIEIERKFAQNADDDMRAMCEEGQVKEALEYIELLHKGGLRMRSKSYAFLLQECAKLKALDEGKKVHALLITSDVKMDVTIRNHLLSLYVKCGCLKEARLMFEAMGPARDVVSWTLMINACAQYGQFDEAIKQFHTMRKRRVTPNKITFVCLLKACTQADRLATGKLIHEHIMKRCLEGDPYVGGALVDMYFKFGEVKAAREAFYKISNTNSFLWNLLVAGLVENGKSKEALRVYRHMGYRHCVEPTEATWVHVIKACGDLAHLDEGRIAHFYLCRDGIAVDGCIGQELVYMYITCGNLVDARQVFDQLQSRPVWLWMHLIKAYTECEEHEEAAKLTCKMQEQEKLLAESGQTDGIKEHEEVSEHICQMQDYEEESVESDTMEDKLNAHVFF